MGVNFNLSFNNMVLLSVHLNTYILVLSLVGPQKAYFCLDLRNQYSHNSIITVP